MIYFLILAPMIACVASMALVVHVAQYPDRGDVKEMCEYLKTSRYVVW